jgi:ribonucleoside-diphosphate reductase alpha chain
VAVHDELLSRAEKSGDWSLYDPFECPLIIGALSSEVELVQHNCRRKRTVRASEIIEGIAECAWEVVDPGVIFIDSINAHNPTPRLGKIRSTNPCGKTPLLDWEDCNLGSINLVAYVKSDGSGILWDKLARDVELAVRFLDDVINMSRYPDKRIEDAVRGTRKIGLGVNQIGSPSDNYN